MPEADLRRWIRVVGGTLSASQGRNLSSNEAERVFSLMLEGGGSEGQVGAFLSLIRSRGASADELVGFARAARTRLRFPELPPHSVVVATTRLGKLQLALQVSERALVHQRLPVPRGREQVAALQLVA